MTEMIIERVVNQVVLGIIVDLQVIKEMIDDFENQVNSLSGITEVIDNLLHKYKGEVK